MGALYSVAKPSALPKHTTTPLFAIGKSISHSIYKAIVAEASECNESIPYELVLECMQFVGFIIDSDILHQDEKHSLYKLLTRHHNVGNIESSLTNNQIGVKYFDLLYRSSVDNEDGHHNNFRLWQKCKDKSNLVMIFETNADHVFCIYLHNPVCVGCNTPSMQSTPKDGNIALLLLRSHFVYGSTRIDVELSDKQCPRLIQPLENKNMEQVSLLGFQSSKFQSSMFLCANLSFSTLGQAVHYSHSTKVLDFIGNELWGGPSFDPMLTNFTFDFKQVEVYKLM